MARGGAGRAGFGQHGDVGVVQRVTAHDGRDDDDEEDGEVERRPHVVRGRAVRRLVLLPPPRITLMPTLTSETNTKLAILSSRFLG